MRIGVLANPELKELKDIGREVLDAIGDAADIQIDESIAEVLGGTGVPFEKMDADVLVVIGGDGTMLYSLQHTDAVVVGINAGKLGFLTEIMLSEIKDKLGRVVSGDYFVEERTKLKIEHNGKRLPDCMNEAVLHTYHVSKMREFEILVDGKPAMNIRADGIIISTATGSTSYAMSVGGPIIDPRMDAFVIAPIAPFNLGIRPLVIPAACRIDIHQLKERKCVLVLDGQTEYDIEPDDKIVMGRSEKVARFVRFDEEFYKKAWEKLRM